MQTIVIGHKNPDMDSICAAMGYARLKQLMGDSHAMAARAGNTNERIDYVLKKFGVEAPMFVSDLSPRVSDVMERDVVSVSAHTAVYDAIHLIDRRALRGLPVIDDQHRCLGLLSAFKVTHYLFPTREEAYRARMVIASLAGIVETFGGKLLTGQLSETTSEKLLVVGAMNGSSFSSRIQNYRLADVVIFVGDRFDIQMRAIEMGVAGVVVTGGVPIADSVQAAALEAKVPLVSSSYDTSTTVMLARGAVKVEQVLEPQFMSFRPETLLEEARQKTAATSTPIFPVLEEDGTLVGILSKSDFLKPVPRQLILVDHNELTQSVDGADKIPIIEVLDHHRLGGFATDLPILFWNNPVGSTSTLVAMSYQQQAIPIPREIAGLLMAGLISDTLNLSSPTATDTDKRILEMLSNIAGVDPSTLAEEIFSVGSPLLTLTPEQVITADCKEYSQDGKRFSVSQIEELSFSNFIPRQVDLLKALEAYKIANGLYFSALLVTDVNAQVSLLLLCGANEMERRVDFPGRGANMWELAGIVSRKKQLLPYLLQLLAAVGTP